MCFISSHTLNPHSSLPSLVVKISCPTACGEKSPPQKQLQLSRDQEIDLSLTTAECMQDQNYNQSTISPKKKHYIACCMIRKWCPNPKQHHKKKKIKPTALQKF